jgi:dihydroxy-acid dehydratase
MALNRRSRLITYGVARSPNRAMLRAVGFGDGDFEKPIVGVANGHSTMNPCNAGIQPLVDRAMAEELKDVPAGPRRDQQVIRPWERPMYPHGHLAILRGNLAPEGCVAKITGPARVFDSENACMNAIMAKKIRAGDVIVIRCKGPKGGPIALVKEGDSITIDAVKRLIQLSVPAKELAARRKHWKQPRPRYTRGALSKYIKLVSTASRGAVTD